MPEKQPAPPDWVNDVPERYGPDWPEERRCRYVVGHNWPYRMVRGRPCGYPTEKDEAYCLFHRGGKKDSGRVHAEMERAVEEDRFTSNFSGARLWFVDLSGAQVPCVNLSCAEMKGTNLSAADLRHADLSGAGLWSTNLSGSLLWGANLAGARLRDADLSGADLTDADLSGATLTNANLTDALLLETKITPNTDLDGVTWWADDRRPVWRKWLQIGEPVLHDRRDLGLSAFERIYRQIKRCYQESGQYDEAGRFFVREMECKRKQLPRWSLMRAVYHVLHFVSDYFESPWRVVVIGLLVILLFAFLHAGTGFVWATSKDVPAGGQDIGGTAVTLNPFAADWVTMGRGLYFSAITFTATGYGDYVPGEGWGQFLAATESLLGVFLMAMFLVCLARKFGRA